MKDKYRLKIEIQGSKFYYKNNGRHREDGPAMICIFYPWGNKRVFMAYYNNQELTKEVCYNANRCIYLYER